NDYIAIKYQQDFPGTGDPYCTDESVSRRNFYAINSIPRMEIDGGWDGNANSFTDALHNEAKAKPSFLELTANHTISDSGKTITVNVNMNPLADLTSAQNTIYISIIERTTFDNKKS